MLSISMMLTIFGIILVQVIRLLDSGRSPLLPLSEEMQQGRRLQRKNRYADCEVNYRGEGRRPVCCHVILSSHNFDLKRQQQQERSAIRALRCRLNKNKGGAAEEDKIASLEEDGVPL